MLNKFVSNLQFHSKKAIAIIMLGTIIVSTSGCNKSEPIEVSLEKVIEDNKDNSKLDEILAMNEKCGIKEVSSDDSESMSFNDSIKRLESYLQLERTIDSLNFKDVEEFNELDDNVKEELESMSDVEVEQLIEDYNDKKTSDIQKLRSKQRLNYLQSYYQKWISNNGLSLMENFLKKVIKSSVCDASGLEAEYYDCCSIKSCEYYLETNWVEVKDKVSGGSFTYSINNKSGIIEDTLHVLYDVQNNYDDYKKISKLCIDGFNKAKIMISSGAKVDDDVLIPTISEDKAIEKLEVNVRKLSK